MAISPRPVRNGAALLEALVAITVLSVAGVGMVSHVMQSVETARLSAERDREVRDASAQLQTMLLWSRSDLASRVGRSRSACCAVDVTRESLSLFLVALSDTLTGSVILETTIYAQTP